MKHSNLRQIFGRYDMYAFRCVEKRRSRGHCELGGVRIEFERDVKQSNLPDYVDEIQPVSGDHSRQIGRRHPTTKAPDDGFGKTV